MRDVLHLLEGKFSAPIITLSGPGGAGKTQLAQEIARSLASASPAQGAVRFRGFVLLADVTDPASLPDALFAALFPTTPRPAGEPLGVLVEALRREHHALQADVFQSAPRHLLILDNLEQIAGDGGAMVLQTLTEQLPHIICLTTSRRSLEIEGERVIMLAPLALPYRKPATPAEAIEAPSLALWVDRARAAAPDFQLSERNLPDVAAICRLLDGLPLALEIAAARVGTLSPAQMRQTLETGPRDTLTSRRRDISPRHRSLRDAALWSYELLPDHLKRLWTQLSIFHGGWTSDAAASIAQEGSAAILEALDSLRSHSLIVAEADTSQHGDGGMRFRMLETLRDFASEMLPLDTARQARRQHLHYFLTLTEQADRELRGEREAYWMQRLETELPNLRAAFQFALETTPTGSEADALLTDAPLRLCDAIAQFCWLRGLISEGRQWFRAAIAASPADPPRLARAEALRSAAALALNQDDNDEAQHLAQESLAVARHIENRRSTGYARHTLGRIALNRGQYQTAREHLEQAVQIMEEYGPDKPRLIANAQAVQRENLGIALLNLGLPTEANATYAQAMAHWRAHGLVHRYNIAGLLVLQSEAALFQGHRENASVLVREGLRLLREAGARGNLDRALLQTAWVEVAQNKPGEALAAFCESLEVAREIGHRRGTVEAVEGISFLLLDEDSESLRKRGAYLWGWAQTMRRQLALVVHPVRQRFWQNADDRVAALWNQIARSALLLEGSLLNETDAVTLALTPFQPHGEESPT